MVDREKVISERKVIVNPWGFTKLMSNKRRLLKMFKSAISGFVALTEAPEVPKDGEEVKVVDDVKIITDMVIDLVEELDEKNLTWVIDTVLNGVLIDGFDMSDITTRDEQLQQSSGLFYQLVLFVLEVNYGDFLELMGMNELITSESTKS